MNEPLSGVSVVVPVFNPGPYLEPCLESLLRQTLPRSRYEVIFVDDGSTDGTGERLDRAAAQHPNLIRVTHIPNSGWPGKPRNVGTELSTNKYVFYCDADDWLPQYSLEALLARADADDSDMVVSRVIGNGRGVPMVLFEHGDFCTTWQQTPGVFSNLTTQKLFRREFLRERGIRFREGRVRLEDFLFMTEALLRAERISILGSRPCYVFEKRADQGNLTATAADESDFFRSVEQIIDLVIANTAIGAERDRALDRVLSTELIGQVAGPGYLRKDEGVRAEAFGQVQRLLAGRIPTSAVSRLDPIAQRRVAAIAAGDQALLEHWIGWQAAVSADIELTDVRWEAGRLRLGLRAELVRDGCAVALERADGRVFLSIPASDGSTAPDRANRIDVTAQLARTSVYFTLRSRDVSEAWRVKAKVSLHADDPESSQVVLRWDATADVDFATLAGGRALRPGAWDLYVNISSCGWLRDRRVGAVRRPGLDTVGPETVDGSVVRPAWTKPGNLSFEVRPDTGTRAERGQPYSLLGHEPQIQNGGTIPMSPSPNSGKRKSGSVTWQRRALGLARLLGLKATNVRPGTVLLSRTASYEVKELSRGQTYLVRTRSKTPSTAAPGDWGVGVVADAAKSSDLAHIGLDARAREVAAREGAPGEVETAKIGNRAWLVARRDPSPIADLTLENQTMQHLGTRHIAWLLQRYEVDCVLDVGANEGQFAQALRSNGYTGRIVSFEPVPQFVDVLNKRSADDPLWEVRQIALGATEGTVPIRVQRTFSSLLTSSEYGKKRFATLRDFADSDTVVDVPLRRLDAILDELLAPVVRSDGRKPRVFLKMDTQGFDLQVFRGLGDRTEDVVGLQSEVALLLIYDQMPRMSEAVATYEAAGYELSGLYPVTREPDGRVIEYDAVMVRASALPG